MGKPISNEDLKVQFNNITGLRAEDFEQEYQEFLALITAQNKQLINRLREAMGEKFPENVKTNDDHAEGFTHGYDRVIDQFNKLLDEMEKDI